MPDEQHTIKHSARISLKQILLITAAVAGLFVIYRQSQTIAKRDRQIRALESELVQLRVDTQQLQVDDPTKLHVMAIGGEGLRTRAWRIYAPPGAKQRVFLKIDGMPESGLPEIEWNPEPHMFWLPHAQGRAGWEVRTGGEYLLVVEFEDRSCSYEFESLRRSPWTHLARELSGASSSLSSSGGLQSNRPGAIEIERASGVSLGETLVSEPSRPITLFDTRATEGDGPDVLIWMEPAQ